MHLYNAFGPCGIPGRQGWSVAQALIDKNDGRTLLDLSDEPTIRPTEEWEINGHCCDPATVCNGISFVNGKWVLYYGGADSHIGCATEK